MNEEQEDAMFKMADALIGVASKYGSIESFITDTDFGDCLDQLKLTNPERYEKEILIYF